LSPVKSRPQQHAERPAKTVAAHLAMTAEEQDGSVQFYLPLEADDVAAARIEGRGRRRKRATPLRPQ
jgi:hypothetical protein